MEIATGLSRKDRVWKNREVSWDEFVKRCAATTRTQETVAEYRKMTRARRDDIKDIGGFVAGNLKDGRRKNGCVNYRTALTLDLDHAVPGIWDAVQMMIENRCLMYSTHKSTREEPRVRLVIPFSRKVSADEYPAISRLIARDIGIEMVDETSHEPARLMYWPSTSQDGEFLFRVQEGPLLDPDVVLKRYTDWRDTSQWPMSSREAEVVNRTLKKQQDPLEKPGPVGAFCRAYTVTEAIDTFLSDVYAPSKMSGRYDYIPADSSAGVVIYEDKFAYSHHATDPVSGRLLNAFDLVRLHKFGEEDGRVKEDTPVNRLPSYKAMAKFALQDEKVKRTLARERQEEANAEFTDGGDDDAWQEMLELDEGGRVKESLTNFVLIIGHDPHLSQICYNEQRCGVDVRDDTDLPWKPLKPGWADADMAGLAAYIDRVYGIFSQNKLKQALLAVASSRSFHPIKEAFEALQKWDGKERLDRLLVDYLGAADTPYTRAVTRKTLVAAVARIYEPGKKFDYILVLTGPQGIGKSTLFAKLGGKYFSDSLAISDMRDKTGAEKLQGYWILELSELNGIKKMDVETVKSFISRTDDKYRASYGTVVESHPRQCVIVGTSNNQEFLRDITGNRRFWPVEVTGEGPKKPWELDKDTIDQIWAEALFRYQEGEPMVLTGKEAVEASQKQKNAMESDDREGLVRVYLDTPLPSDWSQMDLSARREYLMDRDGITPKGTERRNLVCTQEIWSECFGRDPAMMKKTDAYELNAIMRKIEGWQRFQGNKSGKVRFAIYGPQYAYERSEEGKEENTGGKAVPAWTTMDPSEGLSEDPSEGSSEAPSGDAGTEI